MGRVPSVVPICEIDPGVPQACHDAQHAGSAKHPAEPVELRRRVKEVLYHFASYDKVVRLPEVLVERMKERIEEAYVVATSAQHLRQNRTCARSKVEAGSSRCYVLPHLVVEWPDEVTISRIVDVIVVLQVAALLLIGRQSIRWSQKSEITRAASEVFAGAFLIQEYD